MACLVLTCAASWATAPDPAPASTGYGKVHTFQNWAVACDNTHRCEAVGYQADDADSEPVALLISREAGPQGRIDVKVSFAESVGAPLKLTAGKLQLPSIAEDQSLPATQVKQLLPRLLKERVVDLSDGTRHWAVSLAGASAALLKMDDLQGRIGTPGAIVRKGSHAESSVPRALPTPAVKTRPLPPEQSDDQALAQAIMAAVPKDDFCDDPAYGRARTDQAQVIRLSSSKVLVVSACWAAAYQDGSGAWIANDKPPYAPVKVRFPDADGDVIDEPTFLDIDPNGHAYSSNKGRGIGDCMSTREWGWTGAGFSLIDATESGLCKGFAGGVPLRTWATQSSSKPASR